MADEVYTTRKCTVCSEHKTLDSYPINQGYLRGQCKVCYNKGRTAHYAKNREERLRKRREYEAIPEVAARKRELKNSPEAKERAREAVRRSREKPEVYERQAKRRKEKVEQERADPEAMARRMLRHTRHRATKVGLDFSLTEDWALPKVLAGNCEVSGIPFRYVKDDGSSRRNAFAPSVDRIDCRKGYTEDNCRIVLTAVNLALVDWGLEQFLFIATRTLENNGRKVKKV
jgi:hypothetical protein